MTNSAKKTLIALIIGNILILTIGIVIYQSLLISSRGSSAQAMPRTLNSINRLIRRIQQHPNSNFQRELAQRSKPWIILTESQQAKFKPQTMQELLRHPPSANSQFSIQFNAKQWLNIELRNPSVNFLRLSLLVLIATCLIAIILLNYWAVKRLNNPLRQIIDNLNFAKQQKQWQALAEVGDDEQRLVFSGINSLQVQADKVLKDRTYLLAAISHDLRTPLTRLKLRSDYLKEHEQYPKLIQDIDEMEAMINETLDYFKQSHEEEPNQQFDLVSLLNAISQDAIDLNFSVQFNTDIDKLIFTGKINLLKRALSNLIDNAIRYGGSATITLNQSDDEIFINIEDDGKGLSDEHLSQATTPFYRAESSRSRQTGGTGLGLTIAKEIIQLHHGTLQLSNKAEGGLKASIVFSSIDV